MEALALLLNIPPNKTLLRRHLATHFHLLIGSEAQRLKQDCLENPDYTVLTATAKVKVTRPSAASNKSLSVTAVISASVTLIISEKNKTLVLTSHTELIVGNSTDTAGWFWRFIDERCLFQSSNPP